MIVNHVIYRLNKQTQLQKKVDFLGLRKESLKKKPKLRVKELKKEVEIKKQLEQLIKNNLEICKIE